MHVHGKRSGTISHLGFVHSIAEVSRVAVLHDDAQAVLVQERVRVAHDVGVTHAAQEFHLVLTGLLLLRRNVLELYHLTPRFWWEQRSQRQKTEQNSRGVNDASQLLCFPALLQARVSFAPDGTENRNRYFHEF